MFNSTEKLSYFTESDISNLLVAQKNELIDNLNDIQDGETGDYYVEAPKMRLVLEKLAFISRFWREAKYAYKGLEILDRLGKLNKSFDLASNATVQIRIQKRLENDIWYWENFFRN